MQLKHILLASHGTQGARAAEGAAIALARENGARMTLLYIVPDFWRGMRGDDWLNNAITQEAFGDYLESQLLLEARKETRRIAENASENGIDITIRAMFGKPTECLIATAGEIAPDLIVLGAPRPRGMPGYRSRIYLETVARAVPCSLLIVPHPYAEHGLARAQA
jgi:nucleotide-binding universal stress UspA family protein